MSNRQNSWVFRVEESLEGKFIVPSNIFKPAIYDTREELREAVLDDLNDWFEIIDAENAPEEVKGI